MVLQAPRSHQHQGTLVPGWHRHVAGTGSVRRSDPGTEFPHPQGTEPSASACTVARAPVPIAKVDCRAGRLGRRVAGPGWSTRRVGCMVHAPNRFHGSWAFRFPRRQGELTRLATRRAIRLGRKEMRCPTDLGGKVHWSLGAGVKLVAWPASFRGHLGFLPAQVPWQLGGRQTKPAITQWFRRILAHAAPWFVEALVGGFLANWGPGRLGTLRWRNLGPRVAGWVGSEGTGNRGALGPGCVGREAPTQHGFKPGR
jgi:hypothetical protein